MGKVKKAVIGLVGVAVLAGAAFVAPTLWTVAGAAGRRYEASSVPQHDVAIIFGAQVYPSGRPAPFLKARLDLGAAMFKAGTVKVLVVSGDSGEKNYRETVAMRRYLIGQGVPASKIIEDPAGFDTYDTCYRARHVYGVDKAILVTQQYHLRRAITTCRAVGVDAVGVGDTTVRNLSFWPVGVNREYPANVKMALDVFSRRPAKQMDTPSTAVRDALR